MDHTLFAGLPPIERLALVYAPRPARAAWLAVLALDARLRQLLRARREPILTQIRLAWWRDRLREPTDAWPLGEPLLAALGSWRGQHGSLVGLVDGWETLLSDEPLADVGLGEFVAGKAAAMHALAGVLGRPEAAANAHRAGRGWAIADLLAHLSQGDERAAAQRLGAQHDWHLPRLPRVLRPLTILHSLSARRVADGGENRAKGDFLAALRLGILGI